MGMGTAGIFGKFLQGYMQGRESEKNRKEQQISSLLNQAKEYAEIVDTTAPDNDARRGIIAKAQELGLKAITDLEKISNEKAIGVGGIMRLLGMGGKGKGGAAAAGISQPLPMTSEMQLGGEQPAQPGAGAPAPSPEQGMPPGGLPERMMPPPGAQAGLAPPPGQELISQAPGAEPLPEARPMISTRPMIALPTLPKEEKSDYTIAGRIVSPKAWKEHQMDLAKARGMAEIDLEAKKKESEVAFENQKKWAQWVSTKEIDDRSRQAENVAKDPEVQAMQRTDPDTYRRLMVQVKYGITMPGTAFQVKTVDSQDPITGKRTTQYVRYDVNNPSAAPVPLGPAQDETPTPYDRQVLPYMEGGKYTFAQAEERWGKEYLSDRELSELQKKLQIDSLKLTVEQKTMINKLKRDLAEGKGGPEWARRVLEIVSKPASAAAWETDRLGNRSYDPQRYWVALQQGLLSEFQITWEEFRKQMGGADLISENIDIAKEFAKLNRQQYGGTSPAGTKGKSISPE